MKKIWFEEAWEDYLYWQSQDKKTLKRINALLKDAEREYKRDQDIFLKENFRKMSFFVMVSKAK